MVMSDEQLISLVVGIRESQPALTAAQIHEKLVTDGVTDGPDPLELSRVKKAASKATKRLAKLPPTAAAPAPAAEAPRSKREAKIAKAAEDYMKAAESHMMDQNRKLRIAMGDDEYSAAIATSDRGENFIKLVTERALEAKLTPAEALVPRERLSADLATLEWMIAAEKNGTLVLPEDARTTAVAQIERLRSVRDSKGYATGKSWVTDCFIMPDADVASAPLAPPSGIDYVSNSSGLPGREATGASLDRALAKSGMLSVGGGFDDDID